jgi:hypothetical protein
LSLLKGTGFLDLQQHSALAPECRGLIAMLVASIKTAKEQR